MRIPNLIVILASVSLAAAASAQAPTPAPSPADSIYASAARMVREGRGDAGRAVVDSMLAAADSGSAEYVEALYWQSALAASAAEAERGYRRLAVEYPAARRTGDAMFNLAQLELARGNRVQALRHLERIATEQPAGMLRVRAALLAARLHTEARDAVKACASFAAARAALPEGSVELRNQIEFQSSHCAAVEAQQQQRAAAEAAAAADTPAAEAPAREEPVVVERPASPPPVTKREAPAPAPARAVAPVTGGFSVQLAAFDTRDDAERFAARVKGAGHDARVWGTAKPFRVRVGRWATRAEATRQLAALRTLSRDAYVVAAEPQGP
jgi:cell division septation protein DedD